MEINREKLVAACLMQLSVFTLTELAEGQPEEQPDFKLLFLILVPSNQLLYLTGSYCAVRLLYAVNVWRQYFSRALRLCHWKLLVGSQKMHLVC